MPRSLTSVACLALTAVLLGGLLGWSLRTILDRPDDELDAPRFVLVAATQGTVEQSLDLNATARWEAVGTVRNQAAGIVTSVDIAGAVLAQPGQRLYTVALRPVSIAQGAIPAFRDLGSGARGPDVVQLQDFLTATGFFAGRATGVVDQRTSAAVRRWQRSIGSESDGTVRQADLVYVPELPTRISLVPDVTVGATLNGGEPAVATLPDAPRFLIPLQPEQAATLRADMPVTVRSNAAEWTGRTGPVVETADDGVAISVVGVGDAPVCGNACDLIPVQGTSTFPASIAVVEGGTGTTVPTAAVATGADGSPYVVVAEGTKAPVSVVASAQGVSLVDGIENGTQVRVPAQGQRGNG